MENDLNAMLQSVLSDPAQMAKLTRAAQALMGGAESPAPPPPAEDASASAAPAAPGLGAQDMDILSALGGALGGRKEASRSTALLMAMRPYMKPEKREKLDRAMKLTQMVRMVQAVLGRMGGGDGL